MWSRRLVQSQHVVDFDVKRCVHNVMQKANKTAANHTNLHVRYLDGLADAIQPVNRSDASEVSRYRGRSSLGKWLALTSIVI